MKKRKKKKKKTIEKKKEWKDALSASTHSLGHSPPSFYINFFVNFFVPYKYLTFLFDMPVYYSLIFFFCLTLFLTFSLWVCEFCFSFFMCFYHFITLLFHYHFVLNFFYIFLWVAISNSTNSNSKPSETRN